MADETTSMWDREPIFVRWKVATWEHAALHPKSGGLASRVRDSGRLLPSTITAPIYALLAEAEAMICRLTEPCPPFHARLLRDIDTEAVLSGGGGRVEASHLRGEIDRLFATRFADVVPGWRAHVTEALGSARAEMERNAHSFATLGLPCDDFSIRYGYRINFTSIPGDCMTIATHRSLLMGCSENILQPGCLRDCQDALMR